MRVNRHAVLLACVALFSMIGCTVFSVGPYVLEFRYDPSATPTPLLSAIPPTPAPTALPTIAGDWALTNLTINMPNGQIPCDAPTAITFNVTNVGSGPTPEIQARVHQIGPSRLQLFSEVFSTLTALEPGDSYEITVSLPLHTTPNNRYMIRAMIDFPHAVNEPDERNNEQSTSVEVTCGASPNLRVSGLGIDGVNCTDDTEIRFTVVNDGSANAPGSAVYISVVDTEVMGVPFVPALVFGTSATGSTLLPLYTLPDGNYVLRAKADASLTIFEGNESDNSAETSLMVACDAGPTPVATSGVRPTAQVFPTSTADIGMADLHITALEATGTGVNPRCGENTAVVFTIHNQGGGPSRPALVHVNDLYGYVSTVSASLDLPPIEAGESHTVSMNLIIGPPPNVEHRLQVEVDFAGVSGDYDRTNNTREITYNVDDAGNCPPPAPTGTPTAVFTTGANLVLSGVTITGSGVNPRCGEAFRVGFTIANSGTAPAGPTTLHLRDYIVGPMTMAGTADVAIPGIDAGATFSGSASLLIDKGPNVLHQLLVRADWADQIAENSEADNTFYLDYNVDDIGLCKN